MRTTKGGVPVAGLVIIAMMAACGGGGGSRDAGTDVQQEVGTDVPATDGDAASPDAQREETIEDLAGEEATTPMEVIEETSPEGVTELPGEVEEAVEDASPEVPACAQPCGECQACVGGQCTDRAPVGTEAEAAAASGDNDSFGKAEIVALDSTVTGHIGVDGDLDWYRFCATAKGVVTLTVDFKTSRDAMGLFSMMAPVYTETWLPSLVGIAMSNTRTAQCEDHVSMTFCPTSMIVKFTVDPAVGAYTFYVSGAGDGEFYAGYDAVNPYTMTLAFTPDTSMEADQPAVEGVTVGEADTWDTAFPLTFDPDGRVVATSYSWFWNDIDWFKVTLPERGWLRITADVSALEDGDGNAFVVMMDGSLLRVTDTGVEDVTEYGIQFSVGDSPNCPWEIDEYMDVPAGEYYLRLSAYPASPAAPYKVTIEFHTGFPEDDQPVLDGREVGAQDYSLTAYDLGTIEAGTPQSVRSCFWHYWDEDWFRVQSPSTGGELKVDLGFQEAYDAIGWTTGCEALPGLEVWMYLFQDPDLEFPGVAHGWEDDVPSQTLTFTTVPDTVYYLAIMSRAGWDPDHPYTLTFTMTAP